MKNLWSFFCRFLRRFADSQMRAWCRALSCSGCMQVAAHPQPLSPVGHEMAAGQECLSGQWFPLSLCEMWMAWSLEQNGTLSNKSGKVRHKWWDQRRCLFVAQNSGRVSEPSTHQLKSLCPTSRIASPAPLLCGCAARRCPELARGWTVRIERGGPPCTWRYRLTSDHIATLGVVQGQFHDPLLEVVCAGHVKPCVPVASFAFAPLPADSQWQQTQANIRNQSWRQWGFVRAASLPCQKNRQQRADEVVRCSGSMSQALRLGYSQPANPRERSTAHTFSRQENTCSVDTVRSIVGESAQVSVVPAF